VAAAAPAIDWIVAYRKYVGAAPRKTAMHKATYTIGFSSTYR